MGELGFIYVVLIFYWDKWFYFDGQDLLEVGGMFFDDGICGGWLNWMVGVMLDIEVEIVYVIGCEEMQILLGEVWVL